MWMHCKCLWCACMMRVQFSVHICVCISFCFSGLQSYLLDKAQTAVSCGSLFSLHTHALSLSLSLSLSLLPHPPPPLSSQGKIVDVHETIIREVPPGPTPEGPVYDGPAQVLGPGFAPFKPYLRPYYFHLRVRGPHTSPCMHVQLFE